LAARPATRSFGSLGVAHALMPAEFLVVKPGNKEVLFFQKPVAPKSFAAARGTSTFKSKAGYSPHAIAGESPQHAETPWTYSIEIEPEGSGSASFCLSALS